MTEILTTLNDWDASLLLAVNGWHAEWADTFMYAFSGKWIWIPMYVSLLYVIGRNMSWKMALGCVLTLVLVVVFADQVGGHLIRPMVCRLRPTNPDNPLSEWVHVVNGYRGGRYGFPSCHASNTFGLAFFLFYLFRRLLLAPFLMLWALVTCYSRAYLGVHYPGDLLVGALIGILGATLCYLLFKWLCGFRRQQIQHRYLYVPVLVGMATVVGMLLYSILQQAPAGS